MRYQPLILAILSYCSLLMLGGCSSGKEKDPRLIEIAAIMADSPQRALARLDSINPTSLPEADRNYHGLLTVKARDKAYVTHTSDSLILSVIGYYSSHRRSGHYPEALYYGARVYSDIGDYPSSLRYFQTTLDELPEDTDQLELRGRVMSQMGVTLNTLRLYEKALPYLKESLRIDSIQNDSVNMVYDFMNMGFSQLRLNNLDGAECDFRNAKSLAERVSPTDASTAIMYLGVVKSHKGASDSARVLLSSIIDKMHPLDLDVALSHAGEIYHEAGMADSTYYYAQRLLKECDRNHRTAYHLLLSPLVRPMISPDSLNSYINRYWQESVKFVRNNGNHEALLQNSMYNYQIHDRARQKAEQAKEILTYWIFAIVIALLITISLVFYFRSRNTKNLLKLHKSLDDLKTLRLILEEKEKNKSQNQESNKVIIKNDLEYYEDLREQLKSELFALQEKLSNQTLISHEIISSSSYETLKEYISDGKVISDSNPIWVKLEETVLKSSAEFKNNLFLLAGGNVTQTEYHLALLIKCGMTPTEISILMGRAKATITYRRGELSKKMFEQKISAKELDNIIRSL